MYNFPDKIRCSDVFNATVLGLVKAVQAGLAIFGMFDLNYERNGLLCDLTVDGIQKWITEIGEPHLHVEVGASAMFFQSVDTSLANGKGSGPHPRFCTFELGAHHAKQTA